MEAGDRSVAIINDAIKNRRFALFCRGQGGVMRGEIERDAMRCDVSETYATTWPTTVVFLLH